ncbi:MAG TPA: hypothetical protein VF147_05410 [Vicinamibacterales bacterium]
MKKLLSVLGVAVMITACSKTEAQRANLETANPPAKGAATSEAASVATSGDADGKTTPSASARETKPEAPKPEYREITVPSGTVLPVELTTTVASDTSHVEDEVRGSVRRDVRIDGVDAIPAGAVLLGHVTAAQRPGKVKGRGTVGFRFTSLDLPGPGERMSIRTGTISRLAPATKKQDAAKIGGGAAGGAIIGGIIGGGDGAAKGAAIGGGAGTAVVLSTRGKDVRVPSGTQLSVKLTAPLTVRVPMK